MADKHHQPRNQRMEKLDRVNCARLRRPYGGWVGLSMVMGEWSVRQWIVGVINFPKMYGLYGLKVEMLPIWTDK